MILLLYITIILTVIALLLSLATQSKENYLAGFFKMLASTGFIILSIASGGVHSTYGLIIIIGLSFSWWGDLFLISHLSSLFLLGLVSFFLAHVAYCVAFVVYGITPLASGAALLILAVPAFFIIRWLNPHLGTMRIPVYAYMLVISIMVALAAGAAFSSTCKVILVGAVLFYISDIFVARDRFAAPGRINVYLGLPLYYAAQILLALSAIYAR